MVAVVSVAATVIASVTVFIDDGYVRAEGEGLVAVLDPDGKVVREVGEQWVSVDPGLPPEVRAVADLRAKEDEDCVRPTLRRGRRR